MIKEKVNYEKAKSESSSIESESSDEVQEVKKKVAVPLKLKHKNRVKKIAKLPTEFAQLNSIVKKKYDEFKGGKETYTMCYLDDENELINISDDEDYTVFKEFVDDNDVGIAKVFLTAKGGEVNFNPIIDDAQTVNESVIMDDEISRLQMMRSGIDPMMFDSRQGYQLLEQIYKNQLELLQAKNKKKVKKEKKPKKEKKEKKEKVPKKPKKVKKDTNKRTDVVEEKEVKLCDVEYKEEKVENPIVIEIPHPVIQEIAKREVPIEQPIIVKKPVGDELLEKLKNERDQPASNDDLKHECGIQPAYKRDQELVEPNLNDTTCTECKENISNEVRYLCSICSDYYLCELCEIKSDHDHAFLKLKKGVKFDNKAYDEFCQKMIGIYAPALIQSQEKDVQEAIMNDEKSDKSVKVKPLYLKRAQILNKDQFKDGLIAQRGHEVEIVWEVKNFTNREWSEDIIIVCLPSSDIIVNEQKVKLRLKGSEKGKVSMKFVVPKNTYRKEVIGVNLCLFDKVDNQFMGDELKVNLGLID